MVCKKCGFEYEGNVCPVCRVLKEEQTQRFEKGICIAAMLFGIISYILLFLSGGVMSILGSINIYWTIIGYMAGLLPSTVGLVLSVIAMILRPRDARAIVGLVFSAIGAAFRVVSIVSCIAMLILGVAFSVSTYIIMFLITIISAILGI